MTFRQSLIMLAVGAVLSWSCDSKDSVESTAPGDDAPETIEFSAAQAIYYGDDGGTGLSDMWCIRLYTDMEQDESGNPVGPGQLMQISCNTSQESKLTIDCLEGVFSEPSGTDDYSVGTFNPGYMLSIDMPDGTIEAPAMSYFGDVVDGSTEFVADLLNEGYVAIDINSDGTFTIEGVLTGEALVDRYFTYTGILETIDKSVQRTMQKSLRRR